MDSAIANNRVLLVIHGTKSPYKISYIVNWSKVINDPIPSYSQAKLDIVYNDDKIFKEFIASDDNPYLTMLRYRFFEDEKKEDLIGKFNRIELCIEDCITPENPSTWWDLDDNEYYEPFGSTSDITHLSEFASEIKAVINDHGDVVMGDADQFGELVWFNAW
jgi:hypothetical protein